MPTMLDRVLFDVAKHAVCFSLSTKDRTAHTLEAVSAIGFVDGFDLLWFDGSATPDGQRLPHQLAPDLACLREIHTGVVGGPDFAIFAALERMIALGYDYCGLIENDVKLGAGWFDAVRGLFQRGRDDGLEVGAATAYCFDRWVLYNRGRYAVTLISGATMILFTRQAARLVLDHYRTTTTTEIYEWLLFSAGKDMRPTDARGVDGRTVDRRVSSDLTYDITLQKHGLAVIAAIPPYGRLMDGEDLAHANLGGYAGPASAPDVAREAESFAAFAARLRTIGERHRRGHGAVAPYAFFPSMGFWYVFAHQILFSRASPAELRGRWRFVWEKFDGPFALEACAPDAELIVPLYGRLRGVFCRHGADGGVLEVRHGADRLVAYDCRREIAPAQQLYAALDLEVAGSAPLCLRAGDRAGAPLRIAGLCFAEPQPWLPPHGALDVPALGAALAASAAGTAIRTAVAPTIAG